MQISAETLLDAMNWRYATKEFDSTKELSAENRAALLEALRMSPSSYGLHPWKFVVVNDKSVRRRLSETVPANRSKFEDGSMLVILARRRVTTVDHIRRHIETLSDARGVSVEELGPFKEMLIRSAVNRPADMQDIWNSRQVYVALGCAISAAAMLKVDACPMEGVNPEKFDEILGLDGSEYTTTVAIAFGYRDEEDPFAKYARARRPVADVIQEI